MILNPCRCRVVWVRQQVSRARLYEHNTEEISIVLVVAVIFAGWFNKTDSEFKRVLWIEQTERVKEKVPMVCLCVPLVNVQGRRAKEALVRNIVEDTFAYFQDGIVLHVEEGARRYFLPSLYRFAQQCHQKEKSNWIPFVHGKVEENPVEDLFSSSTIIEQFPNDKGVESIVVYNFNVKAFDDFYHE